MTGWPFFLMAEVDQDVMYKLGRIESLVEASNDKLDAFITESKSKHDNHEGRISSLEQSKVRFYTIASTLGAMGSLAMTVVFKWLNLH
jgi:hypothetical protein